MKTFFFLFLALCISTVQAQKVIKLDPATVTYNSPKVLISSNVNDLKFEMKEEFANEFISNPIKFIETNFDFMSLDMKGYDEVEVRFTDKNGYLKATFNGEGKLVRTNQSFKQILLPVSIWREIYSENVGWSLVSTLYTASGKGNKIDKELYQIKLANGNQTKKVKYNPKNGNRSKIASN